MNRAIPNLLLLLFFFMATSFSKGTIHKDEKKPLSRQEINTIIIDQIKSKNEIFHWKNVDDHVLWSALIQSDSLASIGYKPSYMPKNIKNIMNQIDVKSDAWKNAKDKIVNRIIEVTEEKYGIQLPKAYLFPFGNDHKLPYINIRVFDPEIVAEVRQMPEVRYFDVMGYQFQKYIEEENELTGNSLLKSTSGCTSNIGNIDANDYTTITPQSRRSWHFDEHNIAQAWTDSNKGKGIDVAIIDTGVSDQNDQLNAGFGEGESNVSPARTITKKGFYNNDGWVDQCGHGTAMSGLIAAPRGNDNMPAGVAYQANLISYRGTQDVIIDTGAEQDGVSNSLIDIADNTNAKIVSMSIGHPFNIGQVEDAIVYAYNAGVLIFAAAGTSIGLVETLGLNYVIFPAWLPETVSVTGIKDNNDLCDPCHEGPEVDFVITMQRASNTDRTGVSLTIPANGQDYVGGSSNATATMAGIAALVYSNFPTWDRSQVLNRLIQSSSNYPNRDSNYGWGEIDAAMAVDPNGSSTVCNSSLSNDITMQITNIVFPSTDDGLFNGSAEWVIDFNNGTKFFFDADVDGASGPPSNFIDLAECGAIPMTIDMGSTPCGQNNMPITIDIHEDDGSADDCSLDFGDDDYASASGDLFFSTTSFSVGGFQFECTFFCTPTATPAATVSGTTTVCEKGPDADIVFFAAGGTAPYTINYTVNGASQTATTDANGNPVVVAQSAVLSGTFTYSLVDVIDANGCTQLQSGTATVTVVDNPIAGLSNDSPQYLGSNITFTAIPTGMSNYEFFLDADNDGILDSGESLQSSSSDTYVDNTLLDGDVVGVIVTNINTCTGTSVTTVSVDDCLPIQTLTVDYTNGTVDHIEAADFITANNTIHGGAIIKYDGTNYVELTAGFSADLGATFDAFIDGCDGNDPAPFPILEEEIILEVIEMGNTVSIKGNIRDTGDLEIKITDSTGALLKTIEDTTLNFEYKISQDIFQNGIYFINLHLNGYQITRQILISK